MNDSRQTPANPWVNAPQQQSQGSPRRGKALATVAAVLVVVVLVVVGAWALTGNDSDDSDTAATTSTESPEVTSDAPATLTTVTVAPEEQAEETTTPTAVPLPESSPDPSPEDAPSGSGPLACDGRGVLIVNSVMDDAQNFDQQMTDSRTQWPDAILMEPGDCPSLRPAEPKSGASVYAFVIDYGDDLAALCTAERNGGGNARLLNNDTSYSSPC
jgi:hypothetical protein